jgi:hypothetical protein
LRKARIAVRSIFSSSESFLFSGSMVKFYPSLDQTASGAGFASWAFLPPAGDAQNYPQPERQSSS